MIRYFFQLIIFIVFGPHVDCVLLDGALQTNQNLVQQKKKRLSIDKKNDDKMCRFAAFGKFKLLMASVFSGVRHGRKNTNESWEEKVVDLATCQHHISSSK